MKRIKRMFLYILTFFPLTKGIIFAKIFSQKHRVGHIQTKWVTIISIHYSSHWSELNLLRSAGLKALPRSHHQNMNAQGLELKDLHPTPTFHRQYIHHYLSLPFWTELALFLKFRSVSDCKSEKKNFFILKKKILLNQNKSYIMPAK